MVKLNDILDYFEKKQNVVVHKKDFINNKRVIDGGKNVFDATPEDITFITSKYSDKLAEILTKCCSLLVITDQTIFEKIKNEKITFHLIITDEPKKLMIECLETFFVEKKNPFIHSFALIDPESKIGKDNYISEYVVIEKKVIIGNNCFIEPFVHIKENCIIGNRVFIKSGTIVGGKGFGYVKDNYGKWKSFPHFGKVIIEDDVHIGSNTCIDRGVLSDTIIRKGAKIDNLIHIAHNVVVGENSLIIADAMIGGSVQIGENSWIAPSASIRNGLTIGANAVIGMGAVVTKNVADGITVLGNPAKPQEK